MDDVTQRVIALPNGATVRVRTDEVTSPEQKVTAFDRVLSLDSVAASIAGIAQVMRDSLAQVHVEKATIEFGVEMGVETGQLTSIFVKGDSKADLRVTIEITSKDS